MLNGEVIRLDGAKRRDEWRQKRTSRSLCLWDGSEAAARGMFFADACHVVANYYSRWLDAVGVCHGLPRQSNVLGQQCDTSVAQK